MYYNSQQALCDAIKNHQSVTFRYDLESRTVEPYAIFQATTGNVLLFGVQINNFSGSEPKYFKIDLISSVEAANTFKSDPLFTTRSLRFCKRVICSIDYV